MNVEYVFCRYLSINLPVTDANCVYTYELVAHTQKVCIDMFTCIEHTHLPSQHKTEEAGRIDMFTSAYHTDMP